MPRTKIGLTTSEYAVLGLLQQRPAYGYELQRNFAGGSGLGRVCPIEAAMVYAILKSLSGLELIDGRWDSAQYPPKAVYVATDEGRSALERWLPRPVARMREVRSDFLVKLYFALERDPELARQLSAAQLEVCRRYALEAETELGRVDHSSFDAIVLRSKLSAARCTADWIEEWLAASS